MPASLRRVSTAWTAEKPRPKTGEHVTCIRRRCTGFPEHLARAVGGGVRQLAAGLVGAALAAHVQAVDDGVQPLVLALRHACKRSGALARA